MDSTAINKLIRAEVWPILKGIGFCVFESRSAFAYNPPFVNVVSFQSFNSHLAAGLGCTTSSFVVRLGVHLAGSPGEDRVRRDKTGHLRPFEYQCSLRRALPKRSQVDGFGSEEIFYIDPDGRTTASCFEEVKYLARSFVPGWFEQHNDVDRILTGMELEESSDGSPHLAAACLPGCYDWNKLRSVLLLIMHRQSPTEESARNALASIGQMIGVFLNFSTIQTRREYEESRTLDVRKLWDQLTPFRPALNRSITGMHLRGTLNNAAWATETDDQSGPSNPSTMIEKDAVRKKLWPMLRGLGFSEFTDRLAHRASGNIIEVVEILPMEKADRKALKLPDGIFRIGVGVFWPLLRDESIYRRNKAGEPRPIVNECHISNWLMPDEPIYKWARTGFVSIEDAAALLNESGLGWLESWRDPDRALMLLQSENWELFWRHPMIRGVGALASSRRFVYLACQKHLLGLHEEGEELMDRAEKAIRTSCPRHLHARYADWIEQVKPRFHERDSSPNTELTPQN